MTRNEITASHPVLAPPGQGRSRFPAAFGDSGKDTAAGSGGVPASFALRLAEFRSQALGSLMASTLAAPGGGSPAHIHALLASPHATNNPSSPARADSTSGLAASGRNTSLFDPESAYRMMSLINNKDVVYKAQFSELSQMQAEVREMQQAGSDLSTIDAAADGNTIATRLQEFIDRFNAWDERFDPAMQAGGLLAGTQAAQVSRHELMASIENPFIGAEHGLRGLRNLGITINRSTGQARIDPAQLDAALTRDLSGVAATVQAFGVHFARSAELLNSAGNFIPSRLANLDRVIDYIDANKTSLQAEFGRGDAAQPTGEIARALAEYRRICASQSQ